MKNDQTPANSKSDVGGQEHQMSGKICLVKNADVIRLRLESRQTESGRTATGDKIRREKPDKNETWTVLSADVCSKSCFCQFYKVWNPYLKSEKMSN